MLLYWLIWKKSEFGEISIRSITKWVLEYRTKRIKVLIKVYESGTPGEVGGLEVP
jgi:transposase